MTVTPNLETSSASQTASAEFARLNAAPPLADVKEKPPSDAKPPSNPKECRDTLREAQKLLTGVHASLLGYVQIPLDDLGRQRVAVKLKAELTKAEGYANLVLAHCEKHLSEREITIARRVGVQIGNLRDKVRDAFESSGTIDFDSLINAAQTIGEGIVLLLEFMSGGAAATQ